MASLEQCHPHSNELQVLQRRVRLCVALQRLAEPTASKLSCWGELDDTLKAVKDYWEAFLIEMKVKITVARQMQLLEAIGTMKVKAGDDSEGELEEKVLLLVDSVLPCFGDSEWNPMTKPSNSALCYLVFSELDRVVTSLQMGQELPDGALESATEKFSELVKDGRLYIVKYNSYS